MAEQKSGWDLIFFPSPAFKRMLIVGLGSAVSQQLVGIDAIQYFLLFIINEAGIHGRVKSTWILIGLGVLKLFFTVVAGNILDHQGRRRMMFLSLLGKIEINMQIFETLMQSIFFGTNPRCAFIRLRIITSFCCNDILRREQISNSFSRRSCSVFIIV